MKILYLKLRNFNAVYNAMGTKEVFIDFSKAKNNICILIGPNGSGKTTILSMLQPFADVGNLDIRNGNELIMKDEEGYKEICIQKNTDVYVIKHFYTPHSNKNHSVKSYIEKNGNEMNVNGNVTSFKEFIKEELQLEPDYLKLIRLGSNVSSLISLTTTERKNFMSKIMDDIGIYLQYYKSVNAKLHQLDEMISHTVDKEKRLGIIDKEEAKKEIEKLEKEIEKLEKEYISHTNKLALLNNTIDQIEDVENLAVNLRSTKKKYEKMLSIMDKKDQIESFDVEFYNEKIKALESEISSSENEITSINALIQNTIEHLDSLQQQYRVYQVQYTKELESDKETIKMEDNLNKIRKRLREYEDNIGDFKPNFTKVELENFIIFLKNTQQILGRTYEFGKKPVSKVVELLSKRKNVMNYINSHLIDIDESYNDKTSLFMNTIMTRFMMGKEEVVIDCPNECAAKTLFMQIQNLMRNSNVDDKNDDPSLYHDMEYVYKNIYGIIPEFSNYRNIIESLPDDMKKDFQVSSLYSKISDLSVIYNEKALNELLSLITEYENYEQLLIEYDTQTKLLSKFSNHSNSEYIKEQTEMLESEIEDNRKKITNWRERIIHLKEIINDSSRSLEVYLEIKETIEKFDDIKTLYEQYSSDYEVFTETNSEITNVMRLIDILKVDIANKKTMLQGKISDLEQYKSIQKDLKKMNKIYDEMTLVKEALSSKKGIPLQHINYYLNNTEEMTNELLDIAYDGAIYIDKFDITPTEFSIPFYNKGIRLSDVKYASQGELSFLSVALSFALSRQALTKYNIMLLDEIDGTLDTSNREKFIRILENQIERINAEQSFLITHNAMFSSYPVDILDFSFANDTEQYPLANYITIVR